MAQIIDIDIHSEDRFTGFTHDFIWKIPQRLVGKLIDVKVVAASIPCAYYSVNNTNNVYTTAGDKIPPGNYFSPDELILVIDPEIKFDQRTFKLDFTESDLDLNFSLTNSAHEIFGFDRGDVPGVIATKSDHAIKLTPQHIIYIKSDLTNGSNGSFYSSSNDKDILGSVFIGDNGPGEYIHWKNSDDKPPQRIVDINRETINFRLTFRDDQECSLNGANWVLKVQATIFI